MKDRKQRTENREQKRLSSVFCFSVVCFLLALSCSREKAAQAEHYNLLLITLDTLRADRLGSYGFTAAATPVLDRLAREGVRFEHAISAAPLTLPSHATILTGLLPPKHGLRNNGAGKLPDEVPTLATTLSGAGYRTGAFVGAFVLDRRFGLSRGFEVYDDEIRAARAENATLEAERPAAEVVDRAVEWLRKAGAPPTFVWVHLYDPHAPYAPPEPFRTQFASDPYSGEIAYVDAQVGRLLKELDRLRIAERTIVVVVGDHGEALGEHGELTHGVLLYEPTLRVPLIIRAPKILSPRVVGAPVSLAELAPALTSLLLGRDSDLSAGLLAGRELKEKLIYSETEYPMLFGWSPLAVSRRGSMKFIDSPSPELYDLARDPGETRNLYGTERRTMRALSQALESIRVIQTPPQTSPLDPETARKLASLGYVAPSSPVTTGDLENPAKMIGLFRRFEEATWELGAGRYGEAIAGLESLVRADAENPVFRSTLAKALRQHGKLARAIELYRETVALRPDDSEAWYNLAATFQEVGDHGRAAAAVREAIRRDPSRPEAHNVLGIAYSSAGKPREALEQFQEAARLDPRNARAFNNSGNILRAMQRDADAEAAYKRAVELDPLYSDPLNGLGALEVERNRPRIALQYFERALVLTPAAHEIRLNRAVAYQLLGDTPSAVREYRAFIEAVENDATFAAQRRAAQAMMRQLSRR